MATKPSQVTELTPLQLLGYEPRGPDMRRVVAELERQRLREMELAARQTYHDELGGDDAPDSGREGP